MKDFVLPMIVLLLALACYATGLDGAGMALLFIGAAAAIAQWLHSAGGSRRVPPRTPARIGARR